MGRRRAGVGWALLLALGTLAAGCGGGGGGKAASPANQASCAGQRPASPTRATLILDFLPNPVHVAIYQALADGGYRAGNLELVVRTPTSTSDTLRLLAAGRADLGIVSLLDFLTAYKQGQPVTAVMALEQRPLGSLLTLEKSGITRQRELEGKLVGVTGVPSDLAAVKSMVAHDGGDPARVRTVSIGFNAVQNLVGGKVAAAVGFWNAEGVQLRRQQPVRIFKLDEYGAPPYPELVVFARNRTLSRRPELVCSFVAATVAGYRKAIADPDAALGDLARQAQGLALSDARPQFEALKPVYQANAPVYGQIDLGVIGAYLTWAKQAGVLDLSADPSRLATTRFLPHG
jgi:NitT/TauT family transport system substrate-binding protein/putative hydroxymethylpyrimidine transport system substrate-binding protein